MVASFFPHSPNKFIKELILKGTLNLGKQIYEESVSFVKHLVYTEKKKSIPSKENINTFLNSISIKANKINIKVLFPLRFKKELIKCLDQNLTFSAYYSSLPHLQEIDHQNRWSE